MDVIRKKMVSLKEKLKEVEGEAILAETELSEINNKTEALEVALAEKLKICDEMEEQLEKVEKKGRNYTRQVSQTEKATETSRQARSILESRGQTDAKRVKDLEAELAQLKADNEAVEVKVVKLTKEMEAAEAKLDVEEERVEVADARVKELEVEATQTGNSLRSMVVTEKQGVDRVTSKSDKISDLKREFEAKRKEAEEAEKLYDVKCQECDAKDQELEEQKAAYERIKMEFEVLISEISDI